MHRCGCKPLQVISVRIGNYPPTKLSNPPIIALHYITWNEQMVSETGLDFSKDQMS